MLLYLTIILQPSKHNQQISSEEESISCSYSPVPSTPACSFCWHTHRLLQLAWLAVKSSAVGDVILQSWHPSPREFTAPGLWHVWKAHIWTASALVNTEAHLFSSAGLNKHSVLKILERLISTRNVTWRERCALLKYDSVCGHNISHAIQKSYEADSDVYNHQHIILVKFTVMFWSFLFYLSH